MPPSSRATRSIAMTASTCARRWPSAEATGNHHFSHFGPEANLLKELETVFADYGKTGVSQTRHYIHDDKEAEKYGATPGTFTEWEPINAGSNMLFYEGLHGADRHRGPQRREACRPEDRRRAGDQSGMDPEDPSRQGQPRLLDRGGDRHHPAPDAGLRALHLPAVHRNRRELPARADGGYVQSVHRPVDPDRRRIAWW